MFIGLCDQTANYELTKRRNKMVKAVVGANWGDEGKGKITDMLAENADIIISRWNEHFN